MASSLIPCPHCGCHARSAETHCPSCGEPIRHDDGSVPRSALAVLLGLTAAGAFAASCSGPVALYGPAQTTSGTSSGTSSGTGGATTSSFVVTSSGTGGETFSSSSSGTGGGSTDGGAD
jgi:hypothetical protein